MLCSISFNALKEQCVPRPCEMRMVSLLFHKVLLNRIIDSSSYPYVFTVLHFVYIPPCPVDLSCTCKVFHVLFLMECLSVSEMLWYYSSFLVSLFNTCSLRHDLP